jgi:Xaa-Pro aminopeptidase
LEAIMDKEFYTANRRRLAANLEDGDLMLFFSGEGVRKTADENYPFFTNRNFLYLTGIQQERTALLLQRRHGELSSSLFALTPDPAREVWTGKRVLDGLVAARPAVTLWLCFDALLPERAFDPERQFAARIATRHPHVAIRNSYPLVCSLRKIKTPGEIEAIRQGMAITAAGIARLMSSARPGKMEYELEAEFLGELAARGQRRTAFPSIIASGERIFYLHYSSLMGQVADGELILTDVGAPYDEYCTDISRVFPANGRFSQRQAELYRVAYEANRAVMAQVRPGVPFSMPNRVCREVAFAGLKALGLLDDFADIGKYVWHGVTHHVGLDTHDVGGYEEPMAEHMVFTVDAGIYVREWGIGLRIEDNVCVTADGCENLSAAIPATIEDIEALMAS